jgi:hypothetical protein
MDYPMSKMESGRDWDKSQRVVFAFALTLDSLL